MKNHLKTPKKSDLTGSAWVKVSNEKVDTCVAGTLWGYQIINKG